MRELRIGSFYYIVDSQFWKIPFSIQAYFPASRLLLTCTLALRLSFLIALK
eukprot:TRINITY_DN8692_c0_g1_i1.p1 TRINITY_DN8692_c0_g1~~TRINITY_DN8692_c0_g1_i1.p1  ORF type:complete len:51 (+),score=5.86 TRINITY_DN8692_c0_g1_i1:141-293(+)